MLAAVCAGQQPKDDKDVIAFVSWLAAQRKKNEEIQEILGAFAELSDSHLARAHAQALRWASWRQRTSHRCSSKCSKDRASFRSSKVRCSSCVTSSGPFCG